MVLQRLSQLESAIAERVEPAVTEARHLLHKDFGVVKAVVEGCEISHDVPKNRTWDTPHLEEQLLCLRESGHGIDNRVTYKLSISERELEMLTPLQRKSVLMASTLKPGKAKIKITEVEGV